jgi:WD40 repeat protein
LAFSPDGAKLISGHGDRTVRVTDAASGKELVRHSWHKSEVDWVGCTPDGAMLVSASTMRGGICLADMVTGKLERSIEIRGARYGAFAVSADRHWAALGGSSRGKMGKSQQWLALYDLATGEEQLHLDVGDHYIGALALTPDNKMLVSLGDDATLRYWDVSTGREQQKFHFPAKVGNKRIRFSPDGKTLAIMAGDAVIRLWDVQKGKERHARTGHEGEVISVTFSPDGKLLASASWSDTAARIWDMTTTEQIHALAHPKNLRAVSFLPDGKTLATTGGDGHVRLWDAAKEVERQKLLVDGKQQAVSMSLCIDGKTLMIHGLGCFDGQTSVSARGQGELCTFSDRFSGREGDRN